MSAAFQALVVRERTDGSFARAVERRTLDDLPAGDVLVRVAYSSLNYKDALSATGHRGVTRAYPHTPGIDAAGCVEESASAAFKPGDHVLVTGFDLGMNTPGGFGQFIRVPADWVLRLPHGLNARESMVCGTAGLTAAQCALRFDQAGLAPERGPVLVTGATGGVGCLAVALLARLGYDVAAVTGKSNQHDFLRELGAREVLARADVLDEGSRPLLKGRWVAAVDTVGGAMLASVLKAVQREGIVACCGNVASGGLQTTVYPFILRGISLLGISSEHCPMPVRKTLWDHLAGPWRPAHLDRLHRICPLDALDAEIDRILKGGQVGRVVVDLGE